MKLRRFMLAMAIAPIPLADPISGLICLKQGPRKDRVCLLQEVTYRDRKCVLDDKSTDFKSAKINGDMEIYWECIMCFKCE